LFGIPAETGTKTKERRAATKEKWGGVPNFPGFFNEIFATHPDSKIIQTILLLLLAMMIVLNNRSFFFRREVTPPWHSGQN
jgi:hypothetical protein